MDETFFKECYEADAANRSRQTWKEYADWVHRFYQGKTFPPIPGWSDNEKKLVKALPTADHHEVRGALDRVGRLLGSEWAKDNAVRKVSTSDLQAWGKRFADQGNNADSLIAALAEVEAEVKSRLSG